MTIVRRTEIVMKDLKDLRNRAARVWDYEPDIAISANLANPTVQKLEEKLTQMEDGYRTIAVGTGQAAIATAILSTAKSGDKILLPDSVYGPVRLLADNQLSALGIGATYYNPVDTADLERKITPETKLIYLESPGSLTFEVQDLAAISGIAKQHKILTVIDNTWSTPLYCQPIKHGIDIVIHSLSKLASGKSDVFAGSITVTSLDLYKKIKNTAVFLGHWLSPDDADSVIKGIETLPERLKEQSAIAHDLAGCLAKHPEVKQVFAPFLPSSPYYTGWKKYHSGNCGLFSFLIDAAVTEEQLETFFKKLPSFNLSFGWGGANALAVPTRPVRTITPLPTGHLIRVYTGLGSADKKRAEIIAALDSLT